MYVLLPEKMVRVLLVLLPKKKKKINPLQLMPLSCFVLWELAISLSGIK